MSTIKKEVNAVARVGLCLALSAGILLAAGCGGGGASTVGATGQQSTQPGQLPPSADPSGQLQTLSSTGGVDFSSDFFTDLGTNGRDCSTCHQPNDDWQVSAADVQARFNSSNGNDEIFRTVDGSNCPNDPVATLAERQTAYSLLVNRAVIRVSRPIPTGADFTLGSYSDPYNCVATHGLSLYRRPFPATNLPFETTIMWDGREVLPNGNHFQELANQAAHATETHAQGQMPTSAELTNIVDFENANFTAQAVDNAAGPLDAAGATGGPAALMMQPFSPGVNNIFTSKNFNQNVFTLYAAWNSLTGTDPQSQARESIARGEKIFNTRVINISGVAGLNDVLGQGVIVGSCSTCHSTPNIGNLSVNQPMNIGTAGPAQSTPDMPLYTFNCNNGTSVQVIDPGFALTSGLCQDIGKFKVDGLRGLAARAPYFHDGQAKTLMDVVNFYNNRFALQLTTQDKTDLVNFLNAL